MGTHRVYSWANSWAKLGYEVEVLTATKQSFDGPLDLSVDQGSQGDFSVQEIEYLSFFEKFILSLLKLSLFRSVANRLLRREGVSNPWVTPRDKWASVALKNVEKYQNFDVVVSSFGPAVSHKLASEIKNVYPDVYWVADYRDLWSDNPNVNSSPELQAEIAAEECEVLSSSDLITTVSSDFADSLQQLHPSKNIVVSENGHDISEKSLYENFLERSKPLRGDFIIAYTGNHYPLTQDPVPFFRVLKNLMAENRRDLRLKVEFYGSRLDAIPQLARGEGVDEFLCMKGHVTRSEVLNVQKNASVLLLLESKVDDSGVIPGKLYEYMCSGTPIICVGPSENGQIGKMLTKAGVGVAVGDDQDKLTKVLETLMGGGENSFWAPNLEYIKNFSRNRLANKLIEDINAKWNNCKK
jgi:glycosyltransferase involved in cell wall biosynthesis